MSQRDIDQGLALERQGRLDEAMAAYQAILRQQPDNADVLTLLGMAYARRGDIPAAIARLRRVRALRPRDSSAAFNLGVALLTEGTSADAAACFADTLRLDPAFLPAKANLAALYLADGRAAEALPLLDDVIARGKPSASIWVNRGIALDLLHRPLEACAAFERSLELNNGDLQTLVYLGRAYAAAGDMARARTALERVLERDPGHVEARLRLATSQLEVVYRSDAEIRQARRAYRAAVERAYADLETMRRTPPGPFQRMFDWPFYLPYQGEDVKDDLVRLGDRVCDLGAAWAPAAPAVTQGRGDRLRLGVATAFFWRHSVWKVPTRGWLKSLDRSRFEIVGYHLGTRSDSETDVARSLCDDFRTGGTDITGWASRIACDGLDALLYPEIGMDRPTILLASMRLAPLQITTWGHPVTSGLRMIDWYLSSDLMEPPGGESHYSEALIRLPNLSVCYDRPDVPPTAFGREKLGIAPDRIVYLCCQNISKYLPQNDGLFIDILRAVPAGVLVFVRSGKPSVDSRFEGRLRDLFKVSGLPFESHVTFVAPLSQSEFPSLGAISDVYLDSLEWSGCNTTLETLASNLPIVTYWGQFMRGRHTAAMLQMMGLEDHIAADLKDYVARAIELGRSASLRNTLRDHIRERKVRLFSDTSPVQDLERHLLQHFNRR